MCTRLASISTPLKLHVQASYMLYGDDAWMQLYCHPAKSTGEGLQDVNGGRLCTQAEVARWPVVSEGRATLDVLKRLYVWCVSGDAISLCNYKKHRSVIKHIDLRSTEEHIDYACEAINEKYNIVSYM